MKACACNVYNGGPCYNCINGAHSICAGNCDQKEAHLHHTGKFACDQYPKVMGKLWGQTKATEPEAAVENDSQIAEELKLAAQRTAELAGTLNQRGWNVSVDIYPYTTDKGPVAHVSVHRTQTLVTRS